MAVFAMYRRYGQLVLMLLRQCDSMQTQVAKGHVAGLTESQVSIEQA